MFLKIDVKIIDDKVYGNHENFINKTKKKLATESYAFIMS